MAISGREKTAVRLFASGVNCAQAVLMTYADIAGLTQEQAARVACGLTYYNGCKQRDAKPRGRANP